MLIGLSVVISFSLLVGAIQGRSQDFSKRGSQWVTPRVFSTSSCRKYFDAKQISAVSLLTVVFGAKVLKILQICAFWPLKCCMLFILEMKSLPKGVVTGTPGPPLATPLAPLRIRFFLNEI